MGIASRLRHSCTIERAAHGARDEYGVPAESWTTLRTVRCWYQPASRKELTESSSGGALREDGVVFMLPTDITEADRIVIDGTTYGIIDVHDAAGKDQHYEVMVKQGEVV